MSHAGLAGQCSTCHSGAYVAQNAQTKTPTHIPTTAQCDTCHSSTTTWATGVFAFITSLANFIRHLLPGWRVAVGPGNE